MAGRVWLIVVILMIGCGDGDDSDQCKPIVPLTYHSSITVTEGDSTMFELGLGEADDSASLSLFSDGNPADKNLVFMPQFFDLSPTSRFTSITVTAVSSSEPVVPVEIYTDGDITMQFPSMDVLVVDTTVQNIVASDWCIRMLPSSTTTFGVRLTQPIGGTPASVPALGIAPRSVTVAISSPYPGIAITPATLIFGDADYNVFQTITVTSSANLTFSGATIVLTALAESALETNQIAARTVIVSAPF